MNLERFPGKKVVSADVTQQKARPTLEAPLQGNQRAEHLTDERVMEPERLNRFEELGKRLVGGLSLSEAEREEYFTLCDEFLNATRTILQGSGAGVLNQRKEEKNDEDFSESDIETWKKGAQDFKKFDASRRTAPEGLGTHPELSENENELKAMFLKEKPMVLLDKDPSEAMARLLGVYGIQAISRYLYDRVQVGACIRKHPDVFKKFGSADPDEVMRKIDAEGLDENHIARGILLGFPEESVRDFEKERSTRRNLPVEKFFRFLLSQPGQADVLLGFRRDREGDSEKLFVFLTQKIREYKGQLGINDEDIPTSLEGFAQTYTGKLVNVYGIHWTDYGKSAESDAIQRRLRAAFEKSGILA